MVTSDLGACEWFVWDLRKSGLIDRGHLDQLVGEFLKRNPRAEPPALAEFMVHQNFLSPFQADRILQGKTQGLVLGPYVLADAIGAGSMGQVYKATSKTDNQPYAVKVLPRRSMWNVRLARRQVRAFGQFNHPSVVPFVDVGTSGGQHYLVWPLVEGESLEARIERDGKLSPDASAQVILQVAQGLALTHQHGLFHGLIKPSNVLLGSDNQASILDFGIGSLLAENEGESLVDTMSTANTLTSGLDCSSPESVMDPTNRTPAGDQYSLGCVLYYCLTGRYPFPDGTAVEKMMAHQFKQPTPIRDLVPALPDGLVAVIDRLMQKSPEGRYGNADEIVEALQPFATEVKRNPYNLRTGASASGPGKNPRSAQGQSYSAASAQISTPPGGPLTPVPGQMQSIAPSSYGVAIPGSRPGTGGSRPGTGTGPHRALPSRAQFGEQVRNSAVPDAVAIPTSNFPSQNRPQPLPAASAWVEPPRSGSAFGLFLVVMIAALVTVGVYFLGKNFLFPE